ncbi:MAG: pyruvate dehydrogenase (acetyl-transferring), homodimeric type, partial [Gammaproteobacteria bacterium]
MSDKPNAQITSDHRTIAEYEDRDPNETTEWLEALAATVRESGPERGLYLLTRLQEQAQSLGIVSNIPPFSAYRNSIPPESQPSYPGNLEIEERITSLVRWNALAMVVRANEAHGELGGHIGSFASAAEIFEVGFNHFFRGSDDEQLGDLIFFQPHSAPGVYA